jgi:hypothetical protein
LTLALIVLEHDSKGGAKDQNKQIKNFFAPSLLWNLSTKASKVFSGVFFVFHSQPLLLCVVGSDPKAWFLYLTD